MLTKSKLMSWRQCPRKLWLEAADPGERAAESSTRLSAGLSVEEVARDLMGDDRSVLIDRWAQSRTEGLMQTAARLDEGRIVFEAALGDDVLAAWVDVARPSPNGWTLVEVKNSGSVKDHHIEDAAIQAAAAARSGRPPGAVAIAHLDTSWTYPGGEDWRGLFKETDVTDEVETLVPEIDGWIAGAMETLAAPAAPTRSTGPHCADPHPCAFLADCAALEPAIDRPLSWLPGQLRKDAKALRDSGVVSMDDLPDSTLSALQQRVKAQTFKGAEHFDREGAAADVSGCVFPLQFLDFETVNPPVPLWAGTRPWAQVPVQFSLHTLCADGGLVHTEFLHGTGDDPSRPFAEALADVLGETGSILVYNAGFERSRIRELALRFEELAPTLEALVARIVDLQPVAKARYYHPDQKGSWSIKKVLPCLVPELRYDELEGIQDGGMAIEGYLELLSPSSSLDRRMALDRQLRRYCRLDTLAMVGLWARFTASDQLLADVIAASKVDVAPRSVS